MQRFFSCLLAVCVLGTGCSRPVSKWDRVPVTGRVTINEQPFSGGISFLPGSDVSGPAVGTDGQNGQYEFNKQDGPVAGSYTVMLMPTAGSSLDDENLEMVVEVPGTPPFHVDLAFRVDSSALATQTGSSDFNEGQMGPTSGGPIPASGINSQVFPGGSGEGTGGSAASQGQEEEEKKTDESSERMPTRGPAGKGK